MYSKQYSVGTVQVVLKLLSEFKKTAINHNIDEFPLIIPFTLPVC